MDFLRLYNNTCYSGRLNFVDLEILRIDSIIAQSNIISIHFRQLYFIWCWTHSVCFLQCYSGYCLVSLSVHLFLPCLAIISTKDGKNKIITALKTTLCTTPEEVYCVYDILEVL